MILEAIGDVILKKWALEHRSLFLILGVAIYFIGSIFWIISLRYELLSKAISVFTLLNLLAIVGAGIVLFQDHLSFLNKIGIGLGILSLILIEFF
ncbi:hypothetical protein HZB00_04260 [Candidatus Woesearchaeota archaeon]|nr:hypothetical protein [Candidatus Woesearchaeota archaeon]